MNKSQRYHRKRGGYPKRAPTDGIGEENNSVGLAIAVNELPALSGTSVQCAFFSSLNWPVFISHR